MNNLNKTKQYLYIVFLLSILSTQAQFGDSQLITNTSDGVRWIDSADIDGDGFEDILAANRFGSNVSWYKNVNAGSSFLTNEIAFLNQTSMVTHGDLDGDGDIDIIASTIPDQLVVWYENLDGHGNFSPQKIITPSALNAFFILVEDIDADGDLDVMTGGDASRIEWFENIDGQGNFNSSTLIDNSLGSSRSLAMEDLDGDGDLDLVTDSTGSINVWWFENLDGLGNFGPKQEIGGTGLAANHILLADFDNDGFIDALASYPALDRIVWHKNTDGFGNFSPEINITLTSKAGGIKTADIDNDGDQDVLVSSTNSPTLKWYENEDGLGTFSSEKVIEVDFVGSKCLAIDIDNDGDIDAVRASQNDDTIVWYENQTILSTVKAQLKTIIVHPNPADTALYITGKGINIIATMRVTEMTGTILWESKKFSNTIDTSTWNTGVYFLEIENETKEKRVIKVIKR
ncbi:MAG: T9SS type A sorting domain-containing protein [Patiriisocius sp.]|uniref:T9SS type A sorting domain-containing protein n=1 Tax=Patiriisocius sp. TaxID=2822396 RepID=UPI003EF6A978